MKKIVFGLILSFLALPSVYAGQDRGGGDPCEHRIKVIRNDFVEWIGKGGHKDLNLPKWMTANSYANAMLAQINSTKITCVGDGDYGYPIEINGTPKVCRFDLKDQGSRITCDREKFKALGESEQYALVHHEYAGLSQIETPSGDDSDYSVSNQITAYLVDTTVKKLAVKVAQPMPSDPFPGWRKLDMLEGLNSASAIQNILDRTQFKDCTVTHDESALASNCTEEQKVRFKHYFFAPNRDLKKFISSIPTAFDCRGQSVTLAQKSESLNKYYPDATQTLMQNKTDLKKIKQVNYQYVSTIDDDENIKKQLITDIVFDPTYTKIVSLQLSRQEKRPIAGGSLGNPAYPESWTTTHSLSCHAGN